MTTKPPCPFCGSPFGHTTEFRLGCTNDQCPEFPRIHDPVGNRQIVDEFWEEVQREAEHVRSNKRKELEILKELVEKYYQSS